MRNYFSDYEIDGAVDIDKISPVICFRQIRFEETEEGKKVLKETDTIIKEIEEKAPEARDLLNELDEQINLIRMTFFTSGYRDGMADLMTSMAFNKAEITKVEYLY